MYVCTYACLYTCTYVRTYISSFFQHFLPIHCESEGPLSTYVRMYVCTYMFMCYLSCIHLFLISLLVMCSFVSPFLPPSCHPPLSSTPNLPPPSFHPFRIPPLSHTSPTLSSPMKMAKQHPPGLEEDFDPYLPGTHPPPQPPAPLLYPPRPQSSMDILHQRLGITQVCVCLYVCACVRACIYACACMRVCMCMCVRVRVRVCVCVLPLRAP